MVKEEEKDKMEDKKKIKEEKSLAKELGKQEKVFNVELNKASQVIRDNLLGKTSSKLKKYKFSRVGTALLYEKVGEAEVFDMAYPILRNEDEELGSYIVMQLGVNRYIFLDNITPEDWTPTRNNEVKKLIDVVKYADDDYRVRAKVKGKTFYSKRPIYKTELVEQELNGEVFQVEKEVEDDDGNPVIDYYEETSYNEPKAVSQSGREAIRIGNAYKQRMQRKRALKETFFAKYGMQIMFIFFTIMICGTYYMTTKMQVGAINSEWQDMREERKSSIMDPEAFAKKVVEEQKSIEAHEGAPPK